MKIRIEDYNDWLNSELEKALRPTKNKAGKLSDDTRRAFDEARSFFEDLARKADGNLATKKDPISYRAARVVGRVARDAISNIERIQIPQEVTWDSYKVLRDNLSSTSRTLREQRSNTQREIHGLYLLDMLSFSGIVDRIAKVGEKISQFLEGDGENLQRAKTLTGIVETIRQTRLELEEKEKESAELDRTREAYASTVRELSGEIEKITANNSLRQVLDIEKELRKESREFRTDTLTHLRRPLRKLRDLSQRGEIALRTEEREALGEYIQSPYRSFLSRTSGPYLAPILTSLKSALDSGKLGLSHRKTTRIATQLGQLTRTEHLSEKLSRGRGLLSQRQRLLQDPASKNLYLERKIVLKRIEEGKKDELQTNEKLLLARDKIKTLHKRFDELVAQAESKTRQYLSRDVQIERPRLSK
ncbi:MAG TPA: hypothetical protein VFE96_02560 [Candidatus Bathyarchaeia archaeon]|nr:hypothetical protein [Candidatus Bathyarchaeia archaeon]